jgi:hypothetical protein
MHWAKDRLGNIVPASARLPYRADFRCPCCNAPVFLRAGSYRQAHFAHYGYTGTEKCEYYHPSDETDPTPARPAIEPPKASREDAFVRAGIFLSRTTHGVSLVLRLPRLRDAGKASNAAVVIQTGLGKREILSSQLARTHFIAVAPGVPIATATAPQVLAGVQASIGLAVEAFREDGNFFLATDGPGALLPPGAPLEWGEQYWLVTKRKRQHNYAVDLFEFKLEAERRGWCYYRTILPDPTMASETARAEISRFLGRTVRNPRPRLHVAHPAPHHIAPDGALVYPEDTTHIVLRATGGGQVGASTVYSQEAVPVEALDGEFLKIANVGEDLLLLLDEREQFELRFETCELFQPQGIEVVVQEDKRALFDPGLRESLLSRAGAVRVMSPLAMLLEAIRLEPATWQRRGAEYLFEGEHDAIAIEAGAFGSVLPVPRVYDPSVPVSANADSPPDVSRMKWISWLSVREAGMPEILRTPAEALERSELNVSWRALHKRRT